MCRSGRDQGMECCTYISSEISVFEDPESLAYPKPGRSAILITWARGKGNEANQDQQEKSLESDHLIASRKFVGKQVYSLPGSQDRRQTGGLPS